MKTLLPFNLNKKIYSINTTNIMYETSKYERSKNLVHINISRRLK